MSGPADRPPRWRWAKVVGAFVGMVAAIVLFVPFSSFDAEILPGWVVVTLVQRAVTHA